MLPNESSDAPFVGAFPHRCLAPEQETATGYAATFLRIRSLRCMGRRRIGTARERGQETPHLIFPLVRILRSF